MKQINEDIGFTSDKTTSRVGYNMSSGGGKGTMPQNRIIIRPPTRNEIMAAGTNPSDYQIGQLRILSKILFDLGLSSQVYRSKSVKIVRDTRKTVEKYKKIFKIFCNTFSETEPIQNVRDTLDLVDTDALMPPDIVLAIKNLGTLRPSEDQLLQVVTKVYNANNDYDETREPSKEDTKAVRSICDGLMDVLHEAAKNKQSLKDIMTRLPLAHSINNLMSDKDFKGVGALIYGDSAVKTVADLESDIQQYLDEQSHEGKLGHANTVLHEEAARNLRALAIKLKQDGFQGGLTTSNVFEYLKANEPETIDWLNQNYGLTSEQLTGKNFPTWESFAKFFYTPEMIQKIERMLGTENRPRTLGDFRRGAELAVDAKDIVRRKNRLKNKIENQSDETSVVNYSKLEKLEAKLEAKEAELEEAIKIRDKIGKDLQDARMLGDEETVKELEDAYEKAAALKASIGKYVSSIKHSIKKAMDSPPKEPKKSDIDKLRDLDGQYRDIVNKVKDELGGEVDMHEFEKEFEKDQQITLNADFDPSEIDYRTWSFVINSKNKKVIDLIIKLLNDTLPRITGGRKQDGKWVGGYYNVDAYEPEYSELAKGVYTEIIVDYPAESKLYKMFKENPSLGVQLAQGLMVNVRQQLGLNVSFIDDDDMIKVNEEF